MFDIPDFEEGAATEPRLASPWQCEWGRLADVVPRPIGGFDLPLRLALAGFNLATAAMLVHPFVALALSLGLDGRSPAPRRGDD